MSQRVLFNGAVLVRPGAATKIDASQFENIALGGLSTVGLIGEAVGGQPRTVQVFTTAAAVKAFYKSGDLVQAARMVADPANDPRLPTGAQAIVCYKINNSTQATLSKNGTHLFTSLQYGLSTNSITVALAVGAGSERIITITDIADDGTLVNEVSPALGGVGKFSIQYVGTATACTIVITATTLTLTTASPNVPADDMTLTLSNFRNLAELIRFIDAHVSYTCTSLITNTQAFNPLDLDALGSTSIMALTSIFARNFDLSDWINKNSQIISDTLTRGQTGPIATFTTTGLAGGTRGTSANSDWVTGFAALGGLNMNQVVPLASADAVTVQGTFTVDSILAAAVAHGKLYSSTVGRRERQMWSGVNKTLTLLIAAANTQNSEHLCLTGQKTQQLNTDTGNIEFFPEWSSACLLAGARAGAPLGEPLTWKYLNCLGLSSDSTWSEGSDSDVTSLALNGVVVINNIRGKGFRVDKCVTTYTKTDNDAFTEETIVQIWKNVSFELRRVLEERYTGRPGTLATVNSVPGTVAAVLEEFRQNGAITDSVVGGVVTPAYRSITRSLNGDQLSVAVTISPTPGINFILNTLVLVPARISA
jgi:hypothetical protein